MACPFKASAKTEEESMKRIGEHAAKEHGMKDVPLGMMVKIRMAIKT